MPTIDTTDQEEGAHRRTRSRTRNEASAAVAAAEDTTTPTTRPPPATAVSHLVTTATATPFTDVAFENTVRCTLFEPINEAEAASLTSNNATAASPSNSDNSRSSLYDQLAALHLQSDSESDHHSVMAAVAPTVVDTDLSALLIKVIRDKPGDQVHLSFIEVMRPPSPVVPASVATATQVQADQDKTLLNNWERGKRDQSDYTPLKDE